MLCDAKRAAMVWKESDRAGGSLLSFVGENAKAAVKS